MSERGRARKASKLTEVPNLPKTRSQTQPDSDGTENMEDSDIDDQESVCNISIEQQLAVANVANIPMPTHASIPRPISPAYTTFSAIAGQSRTPELGGSVLVTTGDDQDRRKAAKRKLETDGPEGIAKYVLETPIEVSDGRSITSASLGAHLTRILTAIQRILHVVTPLTCRLDEVEAKVRGMSMAAAALVRSQVAHTAAQPLLPLAQPTYQREGCGSPCSGPRDSSGNSSTQDACW